MRLRQKIIIFISLAVGLGMGTTYLLLHTFLLNRFVQLDEAELRRSLEQTMTAYNQELDNMRTRLLNFSVRDETYTFMSSPAAPGSAATRPADTAFITRSLDPAVYPGNRFDLIALLDDNGQPRSGGSYDKAAGTVTPLSREQLTLLRLIHNRLPVPKTAGESRTGLVNLDNGLMLVTLAPVLNSSGDKPAPGTAVAGRMLNKDELAKLRDDPESGIQIGSLTPPLLEDSGGSRIWTSPPAGGRMSIHAVMNDLFGRPIVLSLQKPRELYDSGVKALSAFRPYYLTFILLLIASSVLFVNRSILRRISSLVGNIRAIGSSKDLSIRIPPSARDEFSAVEEEFNRMIDSLEQTQDELRRQSMLDPLTRLPNRSLFLTS